MGLNELFEKFGSLFVDSVTGNAANVAGDVVETAVEAGKTAANLTKDIYSVIKNDRVSEEILVWKHTKEDFNNNSQLIVAPAEEAIFVKDGKIVGVFTEGKYTLTTENYPFIKELRKHVAGGESPFSCKIYFIDKSHQLELKWGTDTPIQIKDAEFKFAVGIKARGSYSVQIDNSQKLFVKLVGNIDMFTKEDIRQSFKSAFQTEVRNAVASTMKRFQYTVLDMSAVLKELGAEIEKELSKTLSEYGIRLVNFYVVEVSIPEDDPNYKTINEAYANAYAGRIQLDVQGDMWNKLTAKELVKDIANNEGSGGDALSMGAGLGVGVASAGIFNNIANQLFAPLNNTSNNTPNATTQQAQPEISRFEPKEQVSETIKCPNCGKEVEKGNAFCGGCGQKLPNSEYICKNCGEKVEEENQFCGKCGTRRED